MTVTTLLGVLGVRPPRGPLTPVLAYGANANVDALTRKYVSAAAPVAAVIPVIDGRLSGSDVTWTPQLVFNGAMPSTLTPSPGTEVSVWTTWLGSVELRRMNATEGVGTLYSAGRLRGARLRAPGPSVRDPLVYIDCRGPLRVGERSRSAPSLQRAVASPGSRRPRRSAWSRPRWGWRGPAVALIGDNVRNPAQRRARDRTLARWPHPSPTPATGRASGAAPGANGCCPLGSSAAERPSRSRCSRTGSTSFGSYDKSATPTRR